MFKKRRIILLIMPITLKAATNVLQLSNTTFSAIRGEEFETILFIEEENKCNR